MSFNFMPSIFRNFKRRHSRRIFEDGDKLFKRQARQCSIYGQYGFRKSVLWVLKRRDIPVYMVDTSQHWVDFYRKRIKIEKRFHPCWVDVGDAGHLDEPLGYEKMENFPIYTDWLWQQEEKPDFVLIGGRFRVCCFLTSLKHATAGTRLLFDDYFTRPHYHYVEDFAQPVAGSGGQALFVVPDKSGLDMDALEARISQFRMVME